MDRNDPDVQKEIERRINAFTPMQQRAFLKPCLNDQDCQNPWFFTVRKIKDERLPHRIMQESYAVTLNADDKAFSITWPGYVVWQASVAYRKKTLNQPLLPTSEWNELLQNRSGDVLEECLANVGVLPREKIHCTVRKLEYSLHMLVRATDSEMELFSAMYPMAPMFHASRRTVH